MPKEAAIERAVREFYRHAADVWVVKYPAGPRGVAGVPDRLLCVAGMFVGLELKQEGNPPTEKQKRQIRAIRAAGGIAEVIHSLDEAKAIVEPLRRQAPDEPLRRVCDECEAWTSNVAVHRCWT